MDKIRFLNITTSFVFLVIGLQVSGQRLEQIYEPVFIGRPTDNAFHEMIRQSGSCRLIINGKPYIHPFPINLESTNGINYVHFQSVTDKEDKEGYLIESVKAVVNRN